MANTLSPVFKQQFFAPSGTFLSGGLLYSYQAGSTTPLATYNATGATNTNPIVLDAMGRCDCWLPPNVSYKFNLTDSAGNQQPGWPIDNVVNSQLITLYGGVDTGSANSYVLSFTASFSSYVNGTVIYWIPANTNTGASTLNVNGLGVISIVNIDGSALGAGEIVAGSTACVMYYNGSFQLLSLGGFSGTTIGTFGPAQNVASAPTTVLATATGHVAAVTGSTSITSFGAASTLAPIYLVKFTGSLTLVYNATSMILPGSASIQTQAGDACIAQYLGSSNWQVLIYDANTPTVFTVGKPGATSVVSNTTVAADPNLQIALPVVSVYSVEGWINDAGGTSSGGLKGCLAYSGSGTGYWAENGTGSSVNNIGLTAFGTPASFQSAQTGQGSMSIYGTLSATTTGTLSFQWAQQGSDSTASLVGAGSWLRATRLLVSLSAICTPPAISSIGTGTSQTTASVTVTPIGGTGTYSSYTWSRLSGDASITATSPSAATTTFSRSGMSSGNTYTTIFQCVVVDSGGHTTTTTCTVTIQCTAAIIYSGTLTGAYLYVSGTLLGYGYAPPYGGSLSPTTDTNGKTIAAIYSSSFGTLVLSISGFSSNPSSSYFTNLSTNGTNFTSASASYSYASGSAVWQWSTSYVISSGSVIYA